MSDNVVKFPKNEHGEIAEILALLSSISAHYKPSLVMGAMAAFLASMIVHRARDRASIDPLLDRIGESLRRNVADELAKLGETE